MKIKNLYASAGKVSRVDVRFLPADRLTGVMHRPRLRNGVVMALRDTSTSLCSKITIVTFFVSQEGT